MLPRKKEVLPMAWKQLLQSSYRPLSPAAKITSIPSFDSCWFPETGASRKRPPLDTITCKETPPLLEGPACHSLRQAGCPCHTGAGHRLWGPEVSVTCRRWTLALLRLLDLNLSQRPQTQTASGTSLHTRAVLQLTPAPWQCALTGYCRLCVPGEPAGSPAGGSWSGGETGAR